MPKANVHVLAVVRLDVSRVEAESDRGLLEKAEKRVDLDTFHGRRSFDVTFEYDGDVVGYLIDELGARAEIVDSREFDRHMEPESPGLREGPCATVPLEPLKDAMEALGSRAFEEAKRNATVIENTREGRAYIRLRPFVAKARREDEEKKTIKEGASGNRLPQGKEKETRR